jgi:DNA-binding response OmpR family regulator
VKKLLIVSNRGTFIEDAKSLLGRAEFKIFTASSTEEALTAHRSIKADLIIFDLSMPETEMDTFCAEIRKKKGFNKIPLIVICDKSISGIERYVHSRDIVCLVRPVDPDLLAKEVNRIFRLPTRNSPRVPINVTVTGDYLLKSFLCDAHDISPSGIRLETNRVLQKDKIISCLLDLPGMKKIIAKGKVTRVVRKSGDIYQYGVKFVNLSPDERSSIVHFIKERTQPS